MAQDEGKEARCLAVNGGQCEPKSFRGFFCKGVEVFVIIREMTDGAWVLEVGPCCICPGDGCPVSHAVLRKEIKALEDAALAGGGAYDLWRGHTTPQRRNAGRIVKVKAKGRISVGVTGFLSSKVNFSVILVDGADAALRFQPGA